MAHWPGQGRSTLTSVPHHLGALRQRPLLLAQQYARALPRTPVPRHHHPRQRRSRSPAPHQELHVRISAPSSASPWARSRPSSGPSPIPISWTASSPPRAPPKPTAMASCASKARSPPSPPTPPLKNGDYKTEPAKGIQAFAIVWTAWLYSQEWWRQELWRAEPPQGPRFSRSSTIPHPLHPGRRRQQPHPADAHLGEARRWHYSRRFNGNVEKALALDQSARPLHALRHRPLLPCGRRPLRSRSSFPHCTLMPIPSLWGHPAGAGASPADEIPQRAHRRVPEGISPPRPGTRTQGRTAPLSRASAGSPAAWSATVRWHGWRFLGIELALFLAPIHL